jgi:transcriptional regulator
VAHLHGTPQLLDEDENLEVLIRLVAHFERRLDEPFHLDREEAAPIAKGTVGLRIPIDRFEMKRKLSQNKDDETRRSSIAALRGEGPYRPFRSLRSRAPSRRPGQTLRRRP